MPASEIDTSLVQVFGLHYFFSSGLRGEPFPIYLTTVVALSRLIRDPREPESQIVRVWGSSDVPHELNSR